MVYNCELGLVFSKTTDFGEWGSTWIEIPGKTPENKIEKIAIKKYMKKISSCNFDGCEIEKVWLRSYMEKE